MKRGGALRRLTPLKATRKPLRASTRPKAKRKGRKPTHVLWELCKQIVRARYVRPDGSWSCYTCDLLIVNPKDAHTAHFIASSVCGIGLRYSLENLRVCCGACNIWKSGNWPAYYERMVKEVGQEKVDELMRRRHQTVKGGATFIANLIEEYRAML